MKNNSVIIIILFLLLLKIEHLKNNDSPTIYFKVRITFGNNNNLIGKSGFKKKVKIKLFFCHTPKVSLVVLRAESLFSRTSTVKFLSVRKIKTSARK